MATKKKPDSNIDKKNPWAPSKYKKKFCKMLIDHMSKGLSFESFGPTIGVSRRALYLWEKEHSDFMHAKEYAKDCCLLYWEKLGNDHIVIDDPRTKFNNQTYNLNMKCRFREHWGDNLKPKEEEDEYAVEE